MDVPHGLGAQPLGLAPGLQPVYPSLLQQLLVELLQFQRSEFFQGDLADVGLDMVVDVAPVGLVGGWPYLHLGVVLKQHLHLLAHGVLACFGHVQALRRLNGYFQFRFCLRLSLAQHVLVNDPARLRVAPGGVPALPATVLLFAEVALPVCSAFCHGFDPSFAATQHTAEGGK